MWPAFGGEATRRILGREPAFDGVATPLHVSLAERQRLASRERDLQLDQVDAGDELVIGCSTCKRGSSR